nr:putative reverse transcriptase domain-containing protein [Tanacetum cinerariifolium]
MSIAYHLQIDGQSERTIQTLEDMLHACVLDFEKSWDKHLSFMNYLEEQMDREAMINCIKNGDQPLPCVTQVSIAGTSSTEQPPLKDKSMWFDQEKKIPKIDRLARSLLIQGHPNDIYSLIDSKKTAKDL